MFPNFDEKVQQLGSYGGGNHFGECEVVHVEDNDRARAVARSLRPARRLRRFPVALRLARLRPSTGEQDSSAPCSKSSSSPDIPLPGDDRELVYAPLGTPEADAYLDDMALGANFATVNHLLINALVLEAFQEIFPGVQGELVYFISHNIARKEARRTARNAGCIARARRAPFPPATIALQDTPFATTGHPILLPGNPHAGSAVMVADPARP